MSRPFSWFPLASSDPVPGDPVAVRAAGDRYVQVAATIDSTATRLRRLTEANGTVSEAVTAVGEKATKVADDISRAYDRYHGVGGALQDYAGALDGAQVESEAALRDAQAAQHRVDAAASTITAAQHRLDGLTNDEADDDARTRYRTQLTRARSERDDAEVALAAARTRLDAAVTDRDSAAERAIDVIEDGMSGDGLRDNLWENLSDVAHAISEVAGTIAAVAGVASLLLGWVPILGQALAAVAVIAGAVALVADIVLMAAGEGSLTDVLMGVAGLATFGLGRIATTAVRMGATGARGAARLAAGSAAALSPASRVSRGLSGARNALGAIDDMAGAVGTMTRAQARVLAALTSRVDSLRDLTRLAGELHPSTVLRAVGHDLADLRNFRLSDLSRGWVEVRSAQGASATIATFLGNGQAGFELSAVNQVAPELMQYSGEFAQSVNVVDNLVARSAALAGSEGTKNFWDLMGDLQDEPTQVERLDLH